MDRMLSLRYAVILFVCYFLFFLLYYRFYFRPRIYLLLFSDRAYLDYYIDRLPHMRDRSDERQGMASFLQDKRRGFVSAVRRLVLASAVVYLVLLYLGVTA